MAEVETHMAGNSVLSRIFYTLIRGLVVAISVGYTRTHIVGKHNVPKTGAFCWLPFIVPISTHRLRRQ